MNKFQIISIAACFIMAGCVTKTTPDDPEKNCAPCPKDSLQTSIATPDSAKNYDELGIDLLESESFGALKMGMTSTAVMEQIGAPEKKSKAEESEADGATHQAWEYPKVGIFIDMIGKTESKINSILLSAPCTLKTKKQIGIGDSQQAITAAYADFIDKESSDATTIVAGTIYGGLVFTLEGEKVKTIFIGASAE